MEDQEGHTNHSNNRAARKTPRPKKKERTPSPSNPEDIHDFIEPFLLGGEQIVHTAKVSRRHIMKGILSALSSEEQNDLPGVLLITNYRLIFLSNHTLQSEAFLNFRRDKRKSQRNQWTQVTYLISFLLPRFNTIYLNQLINWYNT